MIRTIFIYLYRLNGEPIYVGQTPNVEKRDRAHIRSRKSSFERFLAQEGREKFSLEVVDQVDDVPNGKLASFLEIEMMDKFGTYRPGEFGFNQGRFIGNLTEAKFAAQCAAARANSINSPKYWASMKSPERSKKLREAKLGRALTEEHRRKIGEAAKGRASWIKGKKHTDEAREKMRLGQIGIQTPEHRAHLSQVLKGRPKPKGFGEANRSKKRREEVRVQFLGKPKSEQTRTAMSRYHQVKNGFEFFDCWESQHLLAPAA